MKKSLIILIVVTTILAGLFVGLWVVERNDSNKLTQENSKFRVSAVYTRTVTDQIPVLFKSIKFVVKLHKEQLLDFVVIWSRLVHQSIIFTLHKIFAPLFQATLTRKIITS